MKNVEKSDLSLSLFFYPSMSIEDVRYSIDIIHDSLISKKYHMGVETMKVICLTEKQSLELRNMTFSLTHKYDWPSRFVKGGWGCTLKINNQIYYEDNFFSFVTQGKEKEWLPPPDKIKRLIAYLASLSPIPIMLYGFS